MRSPTLRESAFARARESPEFLPFLAYLFPPPTRPITPSQSAEWTQSLLSHYPKGSKSYVLDALAMDPDRIIPLIPYIISNFSSPDLVLEPQVMGATAGPSNHRPGAGIDHVSPPSTPTASHLVCNELFPDDDDPFIYDEPQLDPAPFCEPVPVPGEDIPNSDPFLFLTQRMRRAEDFPFPPLHTLPSSGWFEHRLASPDSSFEGSDAKDSSVADPSAFACADHGHQHSLRIEPGSQAELERMYDVIAFRVDRDAYHLSIHKLFVLNTAYGLLVGAFSFLGLRMFSYSPYAALICGLPLSVSLMLVIGLPIMPEDN